MEKVLLVIYGEGGHRTEMHRLLTLMNAAAVDLKIVSMGAQSLDANTLGGLELAHYPVRDIRSKHSRVKNLLLLPIVFSAFLMLFKIIRRYRVIGVISTGPGLAIIPMLSLRLMGVKGVYIETFSRFHSRSFSGRVMSKLADRFLVQNSELQSLYPNSEYSGRL